MLLICSLKIKREARERVCTRVTGKRAPLTNYFGVILCIILQVPVLTLNSRELNAQLLTKKYFPTSAAEITVKLTGDLHKKNFVIPSATCRKKAPYDTSEKDHMFVIWHHHSYSLSHRKCFTSSFVTDSLFHRVLHNMLN